MKKPNNFVSPLQTADFDKTNLPNINQEDKKYSQSSVAYQKYILPIKKRDKEMKRLKRKKWWKNNLIPLLGLFFAFISALPVIIDFIGYIQSKIM